MLRSILFATVAVAIAVGTAQAQLVEKKALTLDGAKKIAAAAEAKAKAEGARVVIAVVDEGGNLLLLNDWTTHRWPASTSVSTKQEPQRSIAVPAKCSRIKSRTAAYRLWPCTERWPYKAAYRLL